MRTQTLRTKLEWIDTQIFALLEVSPWYEDVLRRRELEHLTKERRLLSDALAREERKNA